MTKFPENFVWGSATASYQIEGAVKEGGRGMSIWDAMCYTPGKIKNGDNADVACDHYHRFEEDVKLMKSLGLKAYRFSIAWPRIQPDGKGEANREGLAFYNRLIDCLLENGIEPWVTLYHWDLPLALQIEHDGWLNHDMVDYFEKYARICFENFGDRVKNWITFNEPWCSSVLGYGLGEHAPGRVSADEPYLAAHNILLCHARAVTVYRSEFSQNNGSIGITNNCDFRYPLTGSEADKAAAERSLEFFLAWFADPIWKGDYPAVMRERLGERLPQFTTEQKKELLGSSDFFGLNHYSSMLASEPILGEEENDNLAGNGGMIEDQDVKLSVDPAWSQTHMGWNIVPSGCRDLLQWIDERYDRPVIYITENGCACDEPDVETALQDTMRSEFYSSYIQACAEAIEQGVDLRGYFAWSLMDNFEWSHGYGQRFGMCHINYETQERTPKLSAKTFSEIIASGGDVLF